MTPEQLEKAKEIEAEIKKLQDFIHPVHLTLDQQYPDGNEIPDEEEAVKASVHSDFSIVINYVGDNNKWKDGCYNPFDKEFPELFKDELRRHLKLAMINMVNAVNIRIKELELKMLKL